MITSKILIGKNTTIPFPRIDSSQIRALLSWFTVTRQQAGVLTIQGATVADAIRQNGVPPLTDQRWRKAFGRLQTTQVKRMTEFEHENARRQNDVCDLTLDKLILAETAKQQKDCALYVILEACLRHDGDASRSFYVFSDVSERRLCMVFASTVQHNASSPATGRMKNDPTPASSRWPAATEVWIPADR